MAIASINPIPKLKVKIVLDNESLVEFEGKVCWWKTEERLGWFDQRIWNGNQDLPFY